MLDQSTSSPPLYSDAFYAGQMARSQQSARIVMSLLFRYFSPASVLDLGCGRGGWLAAASACGASVLEGRDGPWVDPNALLSRDIVFRPCDMEASILIEDRFDLAMSLEVAEHLPAARAASFVDALCRASDVVLFGAAIPGQGGTGHVNEQWQSYWITLFAERGYECFDLVRARLWHVEEVAWWYRQNTFLFVKRDAPEHTIDRGGLRRDCSAPMDVMHPGLMRDATERPSRQFIQAIVRNYLRNKWRSLSRRLP